MPHLNKSSFLAAASLALLCFISIQHTACNETDEATDYGPFLLYSVSPESVSQPINLNISLEFNSAIDRGTITENNIKLLHPNGDSLSGQFGFAADDTIVTFTPTYLLEYGKTYILHISPEIARAPDGQSLGSVPEFSFTTIPTPQLITDLIALVRGELLPVCTDQTCLRGIINEELNGTEVVYSDTNFSLRGTLTDDVGETIAATGDGQVFYWGIGNNDILLDLAPTSANTLTYTFSMTNGSDNYGPDYNGVYDGVGKVRIAGIEIESSPSLTPTSLIYYGLDLEELIVNGTIDFKACEDLFFQDVNYLQAGCNVLDFDITAELAPPSSIDIRLECDMGSLGSDCDVVGGAVSAIDGLAYLLLEDVIVGLINEQIAAIIEASL